MRIPVGNKLHTYTMLSTNIGGKGQEDGGNIIIFKFSDKI